jgi:hypothetical protein
MVKVWATVSDPPVQIKQSEGKKIRGSWWWALLEVVYNSAKTRLRKILMRHFLEVSQLFDLALIPL